MNYYTAVFSPHTYEVFNRLGRTVFGFPQKRLTSAQRIRPRDRLVCYMTGISSWIGVLDVLDKCYIDATPLFRPQNDEFVVRMKVRPEVWLPVERMIPIREDNVWKSLSFTRNCDLQSSQWTSGIRSSAIGMTQEDGAFLTNLLIAQQTGGTEHPENLDKFNRLVTQQVRRADKVVAVTIPEDDVADRLSAPDEQEPSLRESLLTQAMLAVCGEKMGFRIWLPKNDRSAVLQVWKPEEGSLIDSLPLSYDETTIRTIEQIDVLWLKRRSIVRAFEVEHTTAIYSGLLRMADLLALQPNMDIRLHIVAPETRRGKVFAEIHRPVFSLLEKGPLSESCTYISYDSVRKLSQHGDLEHLSDSVLAKYEEEPE